jgi:hypothetical protein
VYIPTQVFLYELFLIEDALLQHLD